jgi:hypothetical protein
MTSPSTETHPPAAPQTPKPPRSPRPPRTQPPPPKPKPGKGLADHLDSITLLLRTAQLVADRKLADADPALRMALVERLRLARRAVADLQTPARRDPEAVATHGGPVHISGRGGKVASPLASPRPVHPLAGRPPASGGDFLLPRDVRSPVAAYGGEGGN